MFKSGKYYIPILTEEDFKNTLNFIIKNNLKPQPDEHIKDIESLFSSCSKIAFKKGLISLFIYEDNTYFWSNFKPDEDFILLNINKVSIESKIREIFDNFNNVIACNSIEEKHKLFKLLDKLGYKTSRGSTYEGSLNYGFSNIQYYIKPALGKMDTLIVAKNNNYNIIYFSDLIKLIKE